MTRLSVACLSLAFCLASAAAQAAGEKPAIVGNPAIVLEPHATSGAAAVDLRNDLGEAITVHLSVWPAQDAGQGAVVAIKGQPADAGSFDLSIKPRGVERLWITLSAAAADDFDIDLLNGTDRIGKVPVRHKAFAVHLADPKAVLNLHDGKPSDIRVTNDDRESHEIEWRLRIDGRNVCQGRAVVGPKSPGLLTCTPSFEWARLTVAGTLFRPVSSPDAVLIVDQAGVAATQPPLTIATLPVSADFFDGAAQQWINYVVVVAFLVFGGIVSLVLGQVIPNRLTRIALTERFDELQRAISGLGAHTDSSLRVLLRVERSRLVGVLRSRAVYSPEFASIVTQCSQGIDRLKRRAALVQQLEMALRRIGDAETTTRVSSTQAAQARAGAGRAQEILRNAAPDEPEFLAAEKAIADAVLPLESTAGADAAFQAAVAARVEDRKKELLTALAEDPEFIRITREVPQPADMIRTATPDVVATSAIALDRAATKLQLMVAYVRHRKGVTKTDKRERMDKAEQTFLGLLQNSNVASIDEAALVLQQIRDDIYPDSLIRPLRHKEARIVVDPSLVYEGIPLQFSVMFHEPAIERAAAARGAFQCHWAFGDKLNEEAWEVTHYFVTTTRASEQVFTVSVTFTDEHGKPVTEADGKTRVTLTTGVTVRPPRDRRRVGQRSAVELLKLAAALLIAVFGLVAGARDQIAKLDVLPGLIAVFLIGFGADTIKSLLSSKS